MSEISKYMDHKSIHKSITKRKSQRVNIFKATVLAHYCLALLAIVIVSQYVPLFNFSPLQCLPKSHTVTVLQIFTTLLPPRPLLGVHTRHLYQPAGVYHVWFAYSTWKSLLLLYYSYNALFAVCMVKRASIFNFKCFHDANFV